MTSVQTPSLKTPVDIDAIGWGDPPTKNQGEESQDRIFIGVGQALTAWEIVETNLALAFTIFCGGSRGESLMGASGRAYGAVQGGMTRKKMLDEIAEIYSVYENRDFDVGAFKRILKHYGNAADSRNNIAHGVACELMSEAQGRMGWFLVPSSYRTSRNIRLDKWREEAGKAALVEFPAWTYCYTSADLADFTARYEALSAKIATVVSKEIQWQVSNFTRNANNAGAGIQ